MTPLAFAALRSALYMVATATLFLIGIFTLYYPAPITYRFAVLHDAWYPYFSETLGISWLCLTAYLWRYEGALLPSTGRWPVDAVIAVVSLLILAAAIVLLQDLLYALTQHVPEYFTYAGVRRLTRIYLSVLIALAIVCAISTLIARRRRTSSVDRIQ